MGEKPTFLLLEAYVRPVRVDMTASENIGLVERITELGERAAAGTGVEIAEVEVRGAGKARLLRIYIDKAGGVTHADCELISERLGRRLDEEDVIPGDSYTLEVSSPGLNRTLKKPRDFERVVGQKIRLALRQPIDGQNRLEGKLLSLANETLELETQVGHTVQIPLAAVQKANLKFQW